MAKILLVEDTADLAQQVSDILNMEGHQVHTCFNGTDALDWLRTGVIKPDVIITDLLMPGVDGFTLIEQLKDTPGLSHIPIIIMSARSDKNTLDRASSLGVKNFLTKPCTHERLLKSIHSALE